MVNKVDNFLVMHGFEEDELRSIDHRGILYLAIGIAALSAVILTGLASHVWLS